MNDLRDESGSRDVHDDLPRAVVRATDVDPRRHAAALLLLQLSHGADEFDVDEAPAPVRELLATATT